MEISEILNAVTLLLLAGILIFGRSYMKKKGENAATKEDIKGITDKIESVKHEYAGQLEAVRASLTTQIHVNKVRYEKEYKILSVLTKKLIELRDATKALRPTAEFVPNGESDEEWKNKKLERFNTASNALYKYSETKQPFFPKEIYGLLVELDFATRSEAMKYSHGKS